MKLKKFNNFINENKEINISEEFEDLLKNFEYLEDGYRNKQYKGKYVIVLPSSYFIQVPNNTNAYRFLIKNKKTDDVYFTGNIYNKEDMLRLFKIIGIEKNDKIFDKNNIIKKEDILKLGFDGYDIVGKEIIYYKNGKDVEFITPVKQIKNSIFKLYDAGETSFEGKLYDKDDLNFIFKSLN